VVKSVERSNSSFLNKGRLIFDESDNETLRKRRMVRKAVLRLSSILFLLPLILFIVSSFGFLPVKPLELWDIWDALVFLIPLLFGLGLAVLALLASLKNEYVRMFENGIERYAGFPHKVEFFPFDSISRIYTMILSNKGYPTDYLAIELRGVSKKSYRILHTRDFVDKERFLELVGKEVAVESEPIRFDELFGRSRMKRST
jgi:hypothetical protein